MTFNADLLLRNLVALQGEVTAKRYLVGFSGGLDSTVLVHALGQATLDRTPIVAVHVNHALHPDAAAWQEHCRRIAEALHVEFLAQTVAVADKEGIGLEAAARDARYTAIRALMQEGDILMSAHHEEDQAETLLLNLLRGSGLAGLAGIGACQRFGPGLLVRPMLGIPRRDIERYARDFDLHWIEDPSNRDLRFDRNYLRKEILPRLRLRWPAASARLSRSAELAGEAAGLQDDLARLDLGELVESADDDTNRLDIQGLLKLSAARQRNALRYAIRASGLPPAPGPRLRQIQDELLTAREDARPLVRWPGAEVRRYRTKLYLLRSAAREAAREAAPPFVLYGDGQEVALDPFGVLRLERAAGPGIDPELVADGLTLRFRTGGEKIRPYGRKDTRPLKKLLQERAVVPWMRQNLPLLYADDTLVAVADLWIAADCARDNGFQVRWNRKPSIF
jgi:tRNA(Ile)-lysidine synthase